MKYPSYVGIDFRRSVSHGAKTGLALVAVGIAAVGALALAMNATLTEKASIEAAMEALPHPKRSAPISDPKIATELNLVQHELSVPWTSLLTELEAAHRDMKGSVAVLSVVPDPQKHTVRVVAEVRNLSDALKYLERLQQSSLLRYPMLESHERRKDDPEHPIRIKLSADWRT
jgi:hypothetical protein